MTCSNCDDKGYAIVNGIKVRCWECPNFKSFD